MKIITKNNFLKDPDYARLSANTGNFKDCIDQGEHFYNDIKTTDPRDTREQNRIFSELIGEDVLLVDNDVRKFNLTMRRPDNKVHIHHDDCDYIAIIYLSHAQSPEDGTAIVRHKATGARYKGEGLETTEMTEDANENGDEFDISKWQTEIFIPMEYNKLLIFEPMHYHTETRTFGDTPEEARCVEVFHIIKKSRAEYWKEFWQEEIVSGDFGVPEELR